MQTRSEEFHAQAEECQGLADRYGDLIKCQYEQLARQWLFLAAQAKASEERRNRLPRRETSVPSARIWIGRRKIAAR
jgi:hypothetical protein